MKLFALVFFVLIGSINLGWILGNDELLICLSLSMFFVLVMNSSGLSIKLFLYSEIKNMQILFKKIIKFNELLLNWIIKIQITWWSNGGIQLTEICSKAWFFIRTINNQESLKYTYASTLNWDTVKASMRQLRRRIESIEKMLELYVTNIKVQLIDARTVMGLPYIIQWVF